MTKSSYQGSLGHLDVPDAIARRLPLGTDCSAPQIRYARFEAESARRRARSLHMFVKMQTELELIAARFEGDRLRYSVVRQACPVDVDPDETAKGCTARHFPGIPLRRVVVHSTSWRYEQGTLLLTYLAYSDELPFDDLPHVLPRDAKAVGTGVAAVVAHAIGHLAFLVRQEPDKYSHALSRETLAHLAQVEPEVAGRIYREQAA